MNRALLETLALATLMSFAVAASASAQSRSADPRTIQQRYGVQGTYDGTTLHPDGHRSAAVPVTMQDGRTGEFVIPSGTGDAHPVYYRDDQTGDMHPVKIDGHVSRQQLVQAPRAVRYEKEPAHSKKASWEQDTLIIGGAAGGGALIGAAAGGKTGAAVGAAAGGVGGLIYDLLSHGKK